MLQIRHADDRGRARFGWLDSRHSFSFGHYFDPKHMGFSVLRVINDDRVSPGGGFPTHGHQDMEIVSYVLEGALEHADSMGNGSVIQAGDVQRMSAGTGVSHSEFNPSKAEAVRFLQIWFLPDAPSRQPGYEQKFFSEEEKRGRLRLLVSRTGEEGSLKINQDIRMFGAVLNGGDRIGYDLGADRCAWVQVAKGELDLNGQHLVAGDGVAIRDEAALAFTDAAAAEVLLFDLPKEH